MISVMWRAGVVALCAALLLGCGDSGKKRFIEQCEAKGGKVIERSFIAGPKTSPTPGMDYFCEKDGKTIDHYAQ